jgi:cytoskeletal protein RodZ
MNTEETLPQPPADEPLSAGEQLRQARRNKSQSLEEVATATKISHANLQAIEDMDFERLPADPFIKGQIMLYAAFLEIDDHTLASRFFYGRDGGDKRPRLTFLQQRQRKQRLTPMEFAEPAHISSAAIAGILLLLIVCSFTAFSLYFSWNPFAFLTDKIFSSTSATNSLFHPADPATKSGGQYNELQLQAFFKKDCRVLVSLDNNPTFEHTYSKGSSVLWKADKHLSLEFFQSDSADLLLNGSQIPFPVGSDGHFLLRLPPFSSFTLAQ